ncbi:MAG: PD-(D/E)XK nuclease family protein [Actinobacteria bacterium]|nr:PD-(D/E)XK nuclease family protein [Actinomycetota bacterium]
MPFPLKYLSPSQLRAYGACPLQYRYRYVEKVRAPYTPASLMGDALHQTLEANFAQKKSTRADLALGDATTVFQDAWDRGVPGGGLTGEASEAFAQAYADGLRLLAFYLAEVAPAIRPHLVEHRFSVSVPGVPVPVVGTVDLIDQSGTVVDHKTSRRPFDPQYLGTDMQLMCYAIAYGAFRQGARLQPGKLPNPYFVPDVRVDVLIPQEPPVLQRLVATYGQDELAGFAARAHAIAAGIEAGDYTAFWRRAGTPREAAVCTRCPFAATCPETLVAPDALHANDQGGHDEE